MLMLLRTHAQTHSGLDTPEVGANYADTVSTSVASSAATTAEPNAMVSVSAVARSLVLPSFPFSEHHHQQQLQPRVGSDHAPPVPSHSHPLRRGQSMSRARIEEKQLMGDTPPDASHILSEYERTGNDPTVDTNGASGPKVSRRFSNPTTTTTTTLRDNAPSSSR